MKIAFIVTDLSNNRIGGISRVATEVGGALVQSGHEVIAYVLERKNHFQPKEYHGIQLRYIPLFPSLNPDYPVCRFSRLAFKQFCTDASIESFDILQSFNLNAIAYPLYKKECGSKSIPFVLANFETLGMDIKAKWHEFIRLPSAKTLMQIFFEWYLKSIHEKKYLGLTDRIITEDVNTRSALLHLGVPKEKIRLVPSGVNIEQAQQSSPPRLDVIKKGKAGPVIGYIGRIDPRKGVQYLIESLQIVIKSFPDVVVFLAGGSRHGYDQKIKSTMTKLRLEQHVRLLGKIDHDILPYYKLADLIVIPSLSEGIPITLGEAMASRVPVLITRLPGVLPFVQPNDLVHWADLADADDLGYSIIQALNDPERTQRTERALAFITQFHWNKVGRRYLETYRELQQIHED